PPTLGHAARDLDVHNAGALPMPAPPIRRMNARDFGNPPFAQVLGDGALDLAHESGARDADPAAGLHEASEVAEVQVVRSKIRKCVDAHDRIEELGREWQRASVGVDREHAVVDARVADALEVLRSAEPQVDGPHLHAELAPEEDR